MVKYSEIRDRIEIQPLKDEDNQQAYATQYLHNLGNGATKYFKEPSIEYLSKFIDEPPVLKQGKLNFKWDIPFPTTKNNKFKFIDLFAGIGDIMQLSA